MVRKFPERIRFRDWVREDVPVEERSPNAKGIYEKVLALLRVTAYAQQAIRAIRERTIPAAGLEVAEVGLALCTSCGG